MADASASPPVRKRTRVLGWIAALASALLLIVLAAFAWLASEHALTLALDSARRETAGRLTVEGASGTLAGEVAIARIVWRDGPLEVVAEDVKLRFAPSRLFRRLVKIDEAVARRVSVRLPPGDEAPLVLPDTIALPLAVEIDQLAVGSLDWHVGERSGALAGLALAYAGDALRHRLRDLRVRAEGAALAGELELGAVQPFSLNARAVLDLVAPHPAGRIDATAQGTLAALVVEGTSTLAGVAARGRVELAPLRLQPLVAFRGEARDVDLAALDAAWPQTKLDIAIDAVPTPDGFAGTLRSANAAPGPLDRSRVPLARADAAFALRGRVLELASMRAEIPGGGTLAGGGSIELDGWRNRWKLSLASLDLVQLHTALRTTKLAGSIEADVDGRTQRVSGEVAQRDLSLAFAARYDGTTLFAERFVARSPGGSLAGSGRVAFAGAREFSIDARAQRFDPARFGAFPAGAIDGAFAAQGTLAPAIVARVDATIAPGSRLAGTPLEGRVRGRFATDAAEDLDARIVFGSTRLAASGALNRRGQPLALELASKELRELAPLLPRDVPPLAGALDARARVEPRERGAAFALDAQGRALRIGEATFASLRVSAQGRHDAPLATPRLDALAEAKIEAALAGLVVAQRRLDRLEASFAGSAAAHTLAITVAQAQQSVALRAGGALSAAATAPRWQGRVQTLAVDGVPGLSRMTLAAPFDADISRDRVTLGTLRLEGGGALLDVDELAWRDARLATRGHFRGLPVAPVAQHLGVALRWPSDVVLGGRWNIASAPRWQGTLLVERERGDVYVDDPGGDTGTRLALGLDTLRVEAKLDGARLAVEGEMRARLAGNALVAATLAAPAGSEHPFTDRSALAGTLRAHVPALTSLQPWLGTAARVQGQAIAEVNVGGTLREPALSGQVVGYALRVDMPQYGINLADGRLRIVSGPDGLRLEELAFSGGSGRFTASGTIGLPRERGGAAGETRIAWRAENFRALNHPDRRLVVDGDGTLAREQGRWLLAGRLAVDEGVIEYRSTSDTELAEDIVVVGRARHARAAGEVPGLDAPLDVELALELGRDFRIVAEGLHTRLAGRLELVSHRGQPVTAKGTIRTVRGTYYAFGQKLDIDRGRLIFDGPVANPALDIVALRRNLAVEAGVEISGTLRAPLVRLTSNPPVPDNEKLSWLLTGGPSGGATQREMIALQAAQAALAGRGGRTMTQRLAQGFGVDDISLVQRGATTRDDPLAGQVVAVGKRITDRLYVTFEQGLELTTNALRIEYVLSRFFTVSAYAGTTSGVELKFRRNWR